MTKRVVMWQRQDRDGGWAVARAYWVIEESEHAYRLRRYRWWPYAEWWPKNGLATRLEVVQG